MTSLTTRIARTCAVTGALLCLGATNAHAADGTEPTPLRATERAAATQAAGSRQGLDLAQRVAALERAPHTDAGRAPASGATPRLVAGTTTEVHVLARDFVANGSGPAGDLGYVATTARVDDQLVSVWTAQQAKGGPWKAVNAATGDLEATMARKAGGGSLLNEPQVGAWYSVKDGMVRPLNAAARTAVGSGMTLEEYQDVVHDRYADKLPGSQYDESGYAGGFDDHAAPAAPAGSSSAAQAAALGGAGALSLAGLIAARRRRNRG